jgi:ribosomal protein S18 acetylase RimI-like enzyme
VGILWVSIKGSRAFIYDFVIHETLRGKGYGKQALIALDKKLKSMNVKSVSLHVFEGNMTARELYKKMGFQGAGTSMKKIFE